MTEIITDQISKSLSINKKQVSATVEIVGSSVWESDIRIILFVYCVYLIVLENPMWTQLTLNF